MQDQLHALEVEAPALLLHSVQLMQHLASILHLKRSCEIARVLGPDAEQDVDAAPSN